MESCYIQTERYYKEEDVFPAPKTKDFAVTV